MNKIKIYAAHDPLFKDSDTISQNLLSHPTYHYSVPLTNQPYRYWKISARPFVTEFAELVFIDSGGKYIKGKFSPIYSKGFDGDPLTYCTLSGDNGIMVDFGNPVSISRIICLPRSDGNGIYPQNEYELFYHDQNGWKSLGRKIAPGYDIEFNHVP